MKTVKVRVKKEFLNLKEILPLGFETKLQIKVSSQDKHIPAKQLYITNNRGIIVSKSIYLCAQTIPVGNYKGFSFIGVNGEKYNDKIISHAIGYIPLNQIFEKI